MQRKRPARAHLFWLLSATAALGGCSCTPPPADKAPPAYKGLTLRIACPDDLAATAVRAGAAAWAARNEARVETAPYDASGPEPATDAGAWVVAPAEMPRLAAAGLLQPLPETYTTAEGPAAWAGLLPLYRDKLLVWDRTAFALPLLGESPLCYYRRDLLDDAGRRAAFEAKYRRPLGPPRTWEEFADIAEFFHKDGAAAGRDSLPPLPRNDADLDREFNTVAACYARRALAADDPAGPDRGDDAFAFHYDLKTGRPRIDGPGFVRALALLQRLQACRPDRPADDPAGAFARGDAVLCLADAPHIAVFQDAEKSKIRDRFGVCRTPAAECTFPFGGGECRPAPEGNYVPYLGAGGRLAVVPRSAPNPEAAFSLLADLCGRENSRQAAANTRWGGGALRGEHLDEKTRWDGFDLDAERTRQLKDALRETLLHPNVTNPVIRLRTPDERTHRDALAAGLRAALTTPGADPARALAAVAERWAELDRARGAAHRAEYRLSVGLRGSAE